MSRSSTLAYAAPIAWAHQPREASRGEAACTVPAPTAVLCPRVWSWRRGLAPDHPLCHHPPHRTTRVRPRRDEKVSAAREGARGDAPGFERPPRAARQRHKVHSTQCTLLCSPHHPHTPSASQCRIAVSSGRDHIPSASTTSPSGSRQGIGRGRTDTESTNGPSGSNRPNCMGAAAAAAAAAVVVGAHGSG